MKCKICGHRANSLPAMGQHYRKKHPSAMKAKRKTTKRTKTTARASDGRFCPHCGGHLG